MIVQLSLVFEPQYPNISNYMTLKETMKRATFVSTGISPNNINVANYQQSSLCGVNILGTGSVRRSLKIGAMHSLSDSLINQDDFNQDEDEEIKSYSKGIEATPVKSPSKTPAPSRKPPPASLITFSVVSNVAGKIFIHL